MIDESRTTLARLVRDTGTSLAALSAMIGRNPAYLQQFVTRGSPRILSESDRRRLSDYFGIDEVLLGGEPRSPAPLRVPRLGIAASAGPGAFVDQELIAGSDEIGAEFARQLGLSPRSVAMIRVRGDSMEPGLRDGDHILVDTDDRMPGRRGGVFVIRIDEVVMVKRVIERDGGLLVESDNPAAPSIPAGDPTVIGRVVWQMRIPL